MMHVALVGLLLAQASDSTLIARLDSALAAEARTGFATAVRSNFTALRRFE
jgi:hypothetical protein